MCANPHTGVVITPKNAKLQYISRMDSVKLGARSHKLTTPCFQQSMERDFLSKWRAKKSYWPLKRVSYRR